MRYLHFGETNPIEVQDKEEAGIKRICKHLRSIEEVSIFLDLLEASHHSATDVDSEVDEWKQEDTKGPKESQ